MRPHSEGPYRVAITAAATLRHPPERLTDRHLRALAYELADAVTDLDARMRAGLTPPATWQPPAPAEPNDTGDSHHSS